MYIKECGFEVPGPALGFVYIGTKATSLLSGYHVDTLNFSQGHQGHPQGQGCMAISLICMSLLYNTQS